MCQVWKDPDNPQLEAFEKVFWSKRKGKKHQNGLYTQVVLHVCNLQQIKLICTKTGVLRYGLVEIEWGGGPGPGGPGPGAKKNSSPEG